MDCPSCGKAISELKEIEGPFGRHYAKAVCPYCNRFFKWLPKPENSDKRRKSKYTPEKISINYCQLCLRPREYLGKREELEIHHIIEIHESGTDEIKNIWVLCTACHSLVHHERLYLHRHLLEFYGRIYGNGPDLPVLSEGECDEDNVLLEDIPEWEVND